MEIQFLVQQLAYQYQSYIVIYCLQQLTEILKRSLIYALHPVFYA